MESYCYHFTKIENLKSILEKVLLPMNGENSKLVGDQRTGICASLGTLGTVIFSARFWYKMMCIYHDEQIAKSHFNDSVSLKFNIDNIDKDKIVIENLSQYFIKTTIPSHDLNICYLIDKNGNIETDRFKIMLYMMKTIHFPNTINSKNFPYKALIKKIYEDLNEDLINFNEKDYQLLDTPLNIFLNQNQSSQIKR